MKTDLVPPWHPRAAQFYSGEEEQHVASSGWVWESVECLAWGGVAHSQPSSPRL